MNENFALRYSRFDKPIRFASKIKIYLLNGFHEILLKIYVRQVQNFNYFVFEDLRRV
jgi:hypothetical protein